MMKWILAFAVLFGMAFAGQIVNVGETTDGGAAPSSIPEDMDCYAQYGQCLRVGCAAAGGEFNEMTEGCYGGDMGKFAEEVGKCANEQSICIGGGTTQKETGYDMDTSKGIQDEPICNVGFVLLLLAGALFSKATG